VAVERVQCPSCGAFLALGDQQGAVQCTYCGAHLRIAQGASGQPMAILDEIKIDSSILAMNAVRGHLQEKLAELQGKRRSILDNASNEKSAVLPGCARMFGILCLLGGIISFLVAIAGIEEATWVMVVSFIILMGIFVYASWRRGGIDSQAQAQIAPIDKEIQKVQEELARIESKMDELAKKIAQ